MTTGTVNANGQQNMTSNSKVHRINAWVNSVDTSYTPSEQGSCVSARAPSSHAGSDELNQGVGTFLPTKNLYSKPTHEQNTTGYTSTQPLNRRKVNSDKYNNNTRIHSGHLPQHNQKGSFSGTVSVPVRNNVSKSLKQNSKTPAGNSTVHTPFSPLSHRPTVLGMNSDKNDAGQRLPSVTAYQGQIEEDMQLDSQVSFHSFGNDDRQAEEHEKTQLSDNNDIAMEIDNYEELEDQIKLEVSSYISQTHYW